MLIKKPSHSPPSEIVKGRGWRQLARAGKDDGGIEVAEVGPGPSSRGEKDDDGGEGAGNPEIHEASVYLTRAEDATRANDSPNDAGVEENTGSGAGEMIFLGGSTDAFDVS